MKPAFITDNDWRLLQEKYSENMSDIIEKLNNNYPVQYLIGNVEFLNTFILVNQNVLIPRFETELLVDKTIKKINKLAIECPKIIDLGTGSGCIAIALKKNLNCEITAIDNSKNALETAQKNATLNHTQINFFQKDILEIDLNGYDVIISNPPYIEEQEEVDPKTKFEPQSALFAPDNGLYFYKNIIQKISNLESKPTLVAFEIGMSQGKTLQKEAKQAFPQAFITVEKDLTNRDRYLFIQF